MTTKRNIVLAVAAALGVGAALNAGVFARGSGYGFGGDHMMDGPGFGHGHVMRGHGPDYHGHMTRGYGPGYGPHMGGYVRPGMHGSEWYAGHSPGMAQHHWSASVWGLDLTDAQREKVEQIQDQLREQHWALRDQLQDQYQKLRELDAVPNPDREAIDEVYEEILQAEGQLARTTQDAREKVERLLTEEQSQAFTRGWPSGDLTPPCLRFDRRS